MKNKRTDLIKKILLISLSILLLISSLCMIVIAQSTGTEIHSFDQLNSEGHAEDSHEGMTDRSTLEMDFRSLQLLNSDTLSTKEAHYPRLKKMANGEYILFYNSQRTGPDILYVTSKDLRSWNEPKYVFTHTDEFSYATADAVTLANGDIMVVCAKQTTSWGSFVTNMDSCHLVIKTSSDNGATWSEEKVVYTGMVWEPSIIQLDSGEIHIYFTHLAPYISLYGYYNDLRSTGSAIVRSTDGGKTWSPNVNGHNINKNDPYAAWRVMQQKIGEKTVTELATGKEVTVPFFNDQMPVGIQLNNGSIALVTESYIHFNDHPVNGGKYQLSIGFSHDNWATPLGMTEEGPADKLLNVDRAAGPYISQFPSGEVIVSHTNTSSYLEYKIFDTTGHTYLRDFSFDPKVKNLWSSSAVISSHKIAMLVDDGNSVDTSSEEPVEIDLDISYSEHALNHNISAKKQKTTLDGKNADWEQNTEALFIGSLSQAQVSIRSAYDDTYVYFLVEVLDKYLSSSDKVEICIAASTSNTNNYNIVIGPNGLVSKTYPYTADVSKYVSGSIGTDSNIDVGYMAEIRLKRSELANIGFSDSLYVLPKLYNTDGSTTFSYDSITGASITNAAKTLCPKISYNQVNKYDTVYVSSTGNDNAYGDTQSNAVKTLARAAKSLNENGTIIICDNITLSSTEHIKSDAKHISIKGLKGTEIINTGYDIYLYCAVDIDNIKFNLTAADKFMVAQYNDLVIGKNVTCTKTATTSYGILAGFLAVNANTTYANLCSSKDCYIEINSGNWRYVKGGNRRSGMTAPLGHYSGDMTIVVNGGTFEATSTGETQDCTSANGMNSVSGNSVLIITGGTFTGSVYAQSRTGGISTSANGYTANPTFSGSTKVILAGGTVKGSVKALQTVGYPAGNINYTYNTTVSAEYAYGLDTQIVKNGFSNTACFGGYGITTSSKPRNVEVSGVTVNYRYYGGKVFVPINTTASKVLATIYLNDSNIVIMLDTNSNSFTDIGLSGAFPRYIGTAIRITGNSGLRFKSAVNLNNVPSSVKIKKVGTIAAFSSSINADNPLLLTSDKIGESVAYDKEALTEHWYEEKDNGDKVFTAVLINFNENEMNKKVTYRPYITFDHNGNEYTLYGECISRSILDIARQCNGSDSVNPYVQAILSTYSGVDNDLEHSFFN